MTATLCFDFSARPDGARRQGGGADEHDELAAVRLEGPARPGLLSDLWSPEGVV